MDAGAADAADAAGAADAADAADATGAADAADAAGAASAAGTADKRNVVLLTAVVFIVALVLGGQGVFSNGSYMTSDLAAARSEPCQKSAGNNAYNIFVHRHILKESFDRNSHGAWERYLVDSKLCGRTPVQSFVDQAGEEQVRLICSAAGRRVEGATGSQANLCISNSDMGIYDVVSEESQAGCKVESAKFGERPVIVACDKVQNLCLPVHFEKYKNQKPANIPCVP